MVRNFLRKFATPIRGLHQAAYLLAMLTLGSQVLALIRDRIFAHLFGASMPLDIYYAAFKIPNLMFVLVASLTSAYVLIPRITSASQEETKELISNAVSFLLMVTGVIAIVVAIFTPEILTALFPRLIASSYGGTFVLLARLLLLQPILLGLSGIASSVTQVHRQFIIFSFSSILYNIGIIIGAVVFYPYVGLVGIGYGVILGSIAFLAIHIPVLWKAKLMPHLILPSRSVMVPVMKESIPRTLALGVSSMVVLLITALAARVGSGAISVFTFGTNLESVPLMLIGTSYAVAAFPILSELAGDKRRTEFTKMLSASSRHIIVWSLVVAGIIIVLRAHIVRIILGTGHFNWNDTRLVAAVLAILVVALAAQGLVFLLSRAFYAIQYSWRPLLYQLVGAAVSILIAGGGLWYLHRAPIVLSTVSALFRVHNVPGNIVLVFAFAIMLGQIVIALLLLASFHRIAKGLNRALIRPFVHGLLAAVVAGYLMRVFLSFAGAMAPLTTLATVFTQGAIAGIVGLVSAGATLWLLRNSEFRDMRRAVHHFLKSKIPTFGAS